MGDDALIFFGQKKNPKKVFEVLPRDVVLYTTQWLSAVDTVSLLLSCRRLRAVLSLVSSLSLLRAPSDALAARLTGLHRLAVRGVSARWLACFLPRLGSNCSAVNLSHCKTFHAVRPPSHQSPFVRLTALVLDATKIDEVWVRESFCLWVKPHSLSLLSLRGCYRLTSASMVDMVSSQTTLESLNVSGTGRGAIEDGFLGRLLAPLKNLCKLECRNTQMTAEGFAGLSQASPSLVELDLNGTQISDDQLALVGSQVEVLLLQGTRVSGVGVEELCLRAKNLRRLSVIECPSLTNVCVPSMVLLEHVVLLGLKNCHLSAQNMDGILNLPTLQVLNVDNCGITDDMISTSFCAAPLRVLNVRCNSIGDSTCEFLRDFVPTLQVLSVGGNVGITDKGVRALTQMPALRMLDLSFLVNVTREGLGCLKLLRSLFKVDLTDTVVDSPHHPTVMELAELKVRVVWRSLLMNAQLCAL